LLDRKIITNHCMPEIHEKVKYKMTETMQRGLTYFSLTTDAWTSRANHSYVTHTVHYIDEHWKLCSHVLDTCEITTEHSAANLADELQNTLLKWDLSDEKLMAVTSDNARNIVDAIENLSWQHFGCFAHTLQLGVKKVMQVAQVSKALGCCRNLVTHFHHSSKSTYVLKQKQRDLRSDDLNLSQDVVTRWNSSYYMVERIIKL